MASSVEIQREALSNAISGQALTNYPTIYREFMARGIPEADIRPRENVFTFNAWKALGRHVRKGEHGVKVLTFKAVTKRNKETGEEETYRTPWSATVFHVSQTDTNEQGGRQ